MDVDGPEEGTQNIFEANDYGVEVDFDELDEGEQEVISLYPFFSRSTADSISLNRMARARWRLLSTKRLRNFKAKSKRCRSISKRSNGKLPSLSFSPALSLTLLDTLSDWETLNNASKISTRNSIQHENKRKRRKMHSTLSRRSAATCSTKLSTISKRGSIKFTRI